MMARRILTGYVILILGFTWLFICQGTLQAQDKPSKENFFREVLYAEATKNTPLFDDTQKAAITSTRLMSTTGFPRSRGKKGSNFMA
jgi:hypothetical protein